ncbi:MAG: CDP-diacylglycerol--glycerol-3-phosphate 3-phosphatidyltransferase [Rickettsiaceae bacterium]|nr:CDP-diacylglycerol--glycerol-3-phosphate 3-phosphatidyltransferase [Rickettsiaceae bacterium]
MILISNLPNLLTIFRILIVPIIYVLFFASDQVLGRLLCLILFILGMTTDYFDGYVARKYDLETRLGQILDPIADKILVSSCLIILASQSYASVILSILIISREFFVSGLRESMPALKFRLKVTILSKIKTTCQMFAIAVLFFASLEGDFIEGDFASDLITFGNYLLLIVTIISLFTAMIYVRKIIRYR